MKLIQTVSIIALSATLLLAGKVTKADKELENVIQTGQKSSQMLVKTLGSKLKSKMQKGSTLKALQFCADEAYNITQKVNKKLPVGVRVKRVSTKYRSPANAPSADEIAVLDSFRALKNANVVLPKGLVQRVDAKTYKYYKPLTMKKLCLKCHGDISKDVEYKRALAQRYPLDKAMGYKEGDVRGAVVVTIKYK